MAVEVSNLKGTMNKKIRLLSLLALVIFSLFVVLNPAMAKKRSKKRSQKGIVFVDGAAVYKSANFDSPILDYLDKGKSVRISRKVYKGKGGFGAFYKVKLGKKKYGYIADSEISPKLKKVNKEFIDNPDFEKSAEMSSQNIPVDLVRYLGLGISMINYTEEFEGQKFFEFLPAFGLKMSGPGTMGLGPPLDFEVLIAPLAPAYYKKFSTEGASGFLLVANTVLNMNLYVSGDTHAYYGLGLMTSFSKFDVNYDGTVLDSQELRLGALFHLGVFQRFGTWGLRLEGKYYVERESYIAASLGIQTEF